jgi:hypothetical protein
MPAMTRHHVRPDDVQLEMASHGELAEEVRYLRHLIRSVGRQVRGLDPVVLEAWKAEFKASRREIGWIADPVEPDGD